MERINELIKNFEKALKKKIELNSLLTFNENLKPFLTLINQISEKKDKEGAVVKGEDLISDTEKDLANFNKQIAEKFTNLINLTKDIYEDKESDISPHDVVIMIINEFIQEAANENDWGISIYNEILDDLRIKMETRLTDKIVHELLNIKGDIEEIQKIPHLIHQQLIEIQDAISDIGKNYPNLGSTGTQKGLDDEFVSEIGNLCEALTQTGNKIPIEINDKLTTRYQYLVQFLKVLHKEIQLLDAEFEVRIMELSEKLEASRITKTEKPVEPRKKKAAKKRKATKKKKARKKSTSKKKKK
ncbi:MAG: hypothetical protein HWN66_11080 [Candidatus Helarchaeota archaeon]|nr:hypothetical protein [Candidatus Helarchaeota archaeon]